MKTMWAVAVLFLLLPCYLQAGPVPSEGQSREWIQPHPQLTIRNTDKYVDYKRDGKIVFRLIERVTHIKVKSTDPDDPKSSPTHRILEFVYDDKVFASVEFDDEGHLSPTIQVGEGVHFSSGYHSFPDSVPRSADIPKTRYFFHVCVPKYNYYEYVEFNNGKDLVASKETDEAFAKRKEAFIKMAEKGYLTTLSDDAH